MATPCETALSLIQSYAIGIVTYEHRALDHMGDAYTHWLGGNDHACLEDLMNCVSDVSIMASYFGGWSPYGYEGVLHYYLDNCIAAPPELTMSDILNAMENALPHQPLLFVAYLEAYKASCWNATFDEEFFANLVKKWLLWG